METRDEMELPEARVRAHYPQALGLLAPVLAAGLVAFFALGLHRYLNFTSLGEHRETLLDLVALIVEIRLGVERVHGRGHAVHVRRGIQSLADLSLLLIRELRAVLGAVDDRSHALIGLGQLVGQTVGQLLGLGARDLEGVGQRPAERGEGPAGEPRRGWWQRTFGA